MELTTALIFPILVMLTGLVLEYWLIQPLRKNSSKYSRKSRTERQGTQDGKNNVFKELFLLRSSYSLVVSAVLFLLLTIIYFFYVYPFYLQSYQSFFYQIKKFIYTENISYGNYLNEEYVIETPKYVRSGQGVEITIQIDNKTNEPLESVEIRASTRYTRYSSDIPFTVEVTPIEIIFGNVPPQSKEWKTIIYIPPDNLLDNDRIELSFYRNNKPLSNPYFATSSIYVHRINALFIWLFENVLLTYWAYLVLLVIVVISSLLAIFEYHPPDETIRSLSGFLYFLRMLIRASALVLLVIGYSAWSLTYYHQWYVYLSLLVAATTYVPFQILFKKVYVKFSLNKKRIKGNNLLGKP